METGEDLSSDKCVVCPHCGIETRIIPLRPLNDVKTEQVQINLPSVSAKNTEENIQSKNPSVVDLAKAEQLHLQATFRLNECQAHYKVYGSRLSKPAHDGLEFIDAALRLFPTNPKYLNTKALLIADGLGELQKSIEILERARNIAPDDIQIRQNIRDANAAVEALENSQIVNAIAVVLIVLLVFGIIIYVVSNT